VVEIFVPGSSKVLVAGAASERAGRRGVVPGSRGGGDGRCGHAGSTMVGSRLLACHGVGRLG
jgi:hypothetical protein